MTSKAINSSLAPIGDVAGAAGYAASFNETDKLNKTTIKKCLNDPLVLNELTDRVYELLLQDLRSQRERLRNYG